MDAFQAIVGSFFSLLGAAALFALVLKAFSIHNEMAEIKDLLRDMNRNLKYAGKDPLEGEWLNRSAMDDADAGIKPKSPLKPSELQPTPDSTQRESW